MTPLHVCEGNGEHRSCSPQEPGPVQPPILSVSFLPSSGFDHLAVVLWILAVHLLMFCATALQHLARKFKSSVEKPFLRSKDLFVLLL